MSTNKTNNELFGEFCKHANAGLDRCFWPESPCKNTAIRAHSIQNAVVLDLLCENNHVIMPQPKINIATGPSVEFTKVSRNKATTFTGLCDEHDGKLFEPIDKNKFDPTNAEQLFLLAYRSVLRELHAKMKGAVALQKQYSLGVEQGRFNPDVIDEPAQMSISAIADAYTFYLYKFSFDVIYNSRAYHDIEHKVDFVKNVSPSLAVSSVYSTFNNMTTLEGRKDPKCTVLNVFPQDGGIFVIFSGKTQHTASIFPPVEEILEAERHYKLYRLSKLILMHCENFVLSPYFYSNLSEKAKKDIASFFGENIYGNKIDRENNALYLFSDTQK